MASPHSASTGLAIASAELPAAIIGFIRAFGLHHPDRTPCGMPVPVSEAHALSELAESGATTPSRLAAALRLEKSTVSRLTAQLEKRGWIVRTRSERDARSTVLELTEEGWKMAGVLAERRANRFDALLARLPDDDRERVLDAMNLLVDAARESS